MYSGYSIVFKKFLESKRRERKGEERRKDGHPQFLRRQRQIALKYEITVLSSCCQLVNVVCEDHVLGCSQYGKVRSSEREKPQRRYYHRR